MLVIGATLMFACNDAANKFLVSEYDVPLVAAIRYIVHTILMLALLGPIHGRRLVETQRTGLVVVRALCLVFASLTLGLALQLMPVAETTAIIYISPVLVVLLARPILGEQIGAIGWTSAALGFVGVLMIVRPGGGLDPLGIVFALANVTVNVVYHLLSRVLARTERTMAMLFYVALIGAICFGLAMPWYWFGTTPSLLDMALFLSLGVTAGLGHYLFTAAYRYAEASFLAPMGYLHLLWAGLLGFIVFGQLPDTLGLIGMAVIAVAGIAVALRTRFARRPVAEPPAVS